MVDARLADGSRVNAIIPPLAVDGPLLSIRRFPKERLKADDLVTLRALTRPMLDFLGACVKARLNAHHQRRHRRRQDDAAERHVRASSPTASASSTIEDAAELQLHQEHVVAARDAPAERRRQGRRSSSGSS